jgi:hypothetical protein
MKRRRVRIRAAILVILALVVTVIGGAVRRDHDAQPREVNGAVPPTRSESQLVAANYKVLTAAKTRALLRYADAAFACLSNEIDIGKPRPTKTKIVMALPAGSSLSAVTHIAVTCSAKIGDPPRDASFQVRGSNVILYLPKYCILDKKVLPRKRAAPLSP